MSLRLAFDFLHQPDQANRRGPALISVAAAFFTYLLVQLLVATALMEGVFDLKELSGKELSLHPAAALWVMIAGGFFGLFFVLPQTWKSPSSQLWSWGPQPKHTHLRNFGLGLVAWLAAFPLVALANHHSESLISWATGQPPHQQLAVRLIKDSTGSTLQMALVLFSVAVLIPIVEEILFRGFLQSYFRKRMNSACSVLLSALCFALFHFSSSQAWSNVVILSSLFVLGLFLGWLYERQRSLWAPIGLHVAFNALSLARIL